MQTRRRQLLFGLNPLLAKHAARRGMWTDPDSASAVGITILIPAYNEASSIADTIRSLHAQTIPPAEIIVIDDCSTDGTAEVARRLGVVVLRPPQNTGSKAGAQNFAMPAVRTEFVMAIDADTTLAPDAIERMIPAFADNGVAAACGFVIPRHVRTMWERGRYVEYLFAFTFYKQVQEYYRHPMISSGCFSMYRTDVLRSAGSWSTRTLAEDMDLTWQLYQAGHGVRFIPEAISYPIEPHDFGFMRKQLRRWSHGFVQNLSLHWRGLLDVPFLRSAVAVAAWDAVIASFLFLILIPVLAIVLRQPWLLLGYLIDLPALLVPIVVGAIPRRELGRAVASIPAFFVLRTVNAYFFLNAAWTEWVLRRPLLTYEKGH
jgi:cellulose synthase/poly-beta-1,6-N-acetylglucosamine synthase-like glycosyltransferase